MGFRAQPQSRETGLRAQSEHSPVKRDGPTSTLRAQPSQERRAYEHTVLVGPFPILLVSSLLNFGCLSQVLRRFSRTAMPFHSVRNARPFRWFDSHSMVKTPNILFEDTDNLAVTECGVVFLCLSFSSIDYSVPSGQVEILIEYYFLHIQLFTYYTNANLTLMSDSIK